MAKSLNSSMSVKRYKEWRQAIKASLIKKNGNHCGYCFEKKKFHELSIDHIIPTSKGGQDKLYNMLVACIDCNQKKSNMDIEEWLKILEWEE